MFDDWIPPDEGEPDGTSKEIPIDLKMPEYTSLTSEKVERMQKGKLGWANLRHTLVQTSASDLRAQDLLTVMDKYERKGSEEIAHEMSLDQGGRENANRRILESFDTWNVVFTSDFARDDPINMDHWLQLYSTSNDSEAWYGDNLLAHDVLLSKDFFAPRMYFYPPSATAH